MQPTSLSSLPSDRSIASSAAPFALDPFPSLSRSPSEATGSRPSDSRPSDSLPIAPATESAQPAQVRSPTQGTEWQTETSLLTDSAQVARLRSLQQPVQLPVTASNSRHTVQTNPERDPLTQGGLAATLSRSTRATSTNRARLAENISANVNLRADTNRDGLLNAADEAGEQTWTTTQGGILLPNLDDDSGKWRRSQQRLKLSPGVAGDRQLARLHDANDEQVNGKFDLEDLAPLEITPWRDAPSGTRVRLVTDRRSQPYVRLFIRRGETYRSLGSGATLRLSDLRQGATLAMEAKDIVRDRRQWNGLSTVTLVVQTPAVTFRDRVQLRVAPLLFQHHLMPVTQVYATRQPPQNSNSSVAASSDLTPIAKENLRVRQRFDRLTTAATRTQLQRLRSILQQGEQPAPLRLLNAASDRWTQDLFEPAYVAMPKAGGRVHVMHVLLRSANAGSDDRSLRAGGRSVFTELRGRDIGAVQQFSLDWQQRARSQNTFSSTGNFDAIPPHSVNGKQYTQGRIIFGSAPGARPDPSFTRLLESQGYQDPIQLDTSWLQVGHVDEFVTFVPANTARGWVMLVASPTEAYNVLREAQSQGHGETRLFNGLTQLRTAAQDAERLVVAARARTVNQVLADRALQQINRSSEEKINENVRKLQAAIGLADSEIIRLPVLYAAGDLPPRANQPPRVLAFTPNVINGVTIGRQYIAPQQHGFVIEGVDRLQQRTEQRLASVGIRVNWLDNWYSSHIEEGGIHCTTNTLRDPTQVQPWWQIG